jgi:transposase-like protein
MSNGRTFTAEYKSKLIIEILREQNTISEIGAREAISPKQLGNWKREFIENAHRAFSISKDEKVSKNIIKSHQTKEQELMAKIGQLTYECDWLKKKSAKFIV